MSRYRDFDAARAEHAREPLTFRLGGEDFTIPDSIPAGALLDMGSAMAGGDDMRAFSAFTAFFEAIIPEEDSARFAASIRRVDLTAVLDVMSWIVEESTGRPLSMRSTSPDSLSEDGPPSRVVSLSPVKEARSA